MKLKLKSGILLIAQLIGMGVSLFICNLLSSRIVAVNLELPPVPAEMADKVALAWLGICFVNAAVMAYPIRRSHWHGWKLMGAVAVIYFGITDFLSQIESLVFLKYLTHKMTAETIGWLLCRGAVTACLFAPLAVLIMGKMHPFGAAPFDNHKHKPIRLLMPWTGWLWKLGVIAVCYYIIYFTFGFLVAWRSPAVRSYYAGMSAPAWLIPLVQLGRGFIWAGLAVLVVKLTKGNWWESGLAVSLLFAVLMSSGLLLPYNPVMPEAVAAVHFRELFSSNFIFGWVTVWVLNLGGKIRLDGIGRERAV